MRRSFLLKIKFLIFPTFSRYAWFCKFAFDQLNNEISFLISMFFLLKVIYKISVIIKPRSFKQCLLEKNLKTKLRGSSSSLTKQEVKQSMASMVNHKFQFKTKNKNRKKQLFMSFFLHSIYLKNRQHTSRIFVQSSKYIQPIVNTCEADKIIILIKKV